MDETIDMLLTTNKSFVRFGDGEIRLIEGDSLPLQPANVQLAKELKDILIGSLSDIEVGIPDIFGDLSKYRPESQQFWKEHLVFFRKHYEKTCNSRCIYYDAFFSRLHYMYADWEASRQRFERIKQIWAGQDVLIIESKSAHTGVDNDLLEKCVAVHRIIGPESNTYAVNEQIYEQALKYSKDTLVLVSTGPSAKPLAWKLHMDGYRVIDIGSLDMEYQWYCMGVCEKCHPEKKNCLALEDDRQAGYTEYIDQIDCIIEHN